MSCLERCPYFRGVLIEGSTVHVYQIHWRGLQLYHTRWRGLYPLYIRPPGGDYISDPLEGDYGGIRKVYADLHIIVVVT